MIYKVKPGGAICSPDGTKVFKAGMVVPTSGPHALSGAMIQEHLKAGYLRAVAGKAPAVEADSVPGVPKALPVIPTESADGKPVKPEPVKLSSKWAMDPDALRGMNLEQLNVMVLERDESVLEFEDKDEAIAWLSQDYEAPEAPEEDAE